MTTHHISAATLRKHALTIIANHVGLSFDALTPDARLDEDLGCDSLDVVELLIGLENEFDVVFSPEEDATVTTVGDLFNLVEIHAGVAS